MIKKRIIIEKNIDTINLAEVESSTPVFAEIKGILKGMLVYEENKTTRGRKWILRLGGGSGCSGFHDSRQECIQSGLDNGYEFFIVGDK